MHECLHRILGRPSRAGPERVPAVPQQSDREVPVGSRSLPSNPQRLNNERGHIGPRPNAQTRNGNEWHRFLLPPEYLISVSNGQARRRPRGRKPLAGGCQVTTPGRGASGPSRGASGRNTSIMPERSFLTVKGRATCPTPVWASGSRAWGIEGAGALEGTACWKNGTPA